MPISVHIPPKMAEYESGIRNFLRDNPARLHHALMWGIKMTTMGVLFRKAEIKATVGTIRIYPRRIVLPSGVGNRWLIIGVRHSLERIPSLTRKSRATVIIPLFEKPASASVVDITPAARSSTTTEKSINPGRRYSFISR